MLAMLGALTFLVTQYQAVSSSQALITEGYLPLAQSVDDLQPYHDRVRRDIERLLGDPARYGASR